MLKLVKRKNQKFWIARGTINGKRVERSTKCTRKSDAEIRLREIEQDALRAEGGEAQGQPVTFARAVTYYVKLGHDPRFIGPLLNHFGEKPLVEITGQKVQQAASALYPDCAPSTINRQVYTPIIAILNLAAREEWCPPPKFKRPKIKRPEMRAASENWYAALIPKLPPNLAALLCFMSVTGCRTSEALFADFDLKNRTASIGKDKRGRTKIVTYPAWVQVMIANLPEYESPSIFGYSYRNSVYETLKRSCARAGVEYLTPHQAGRHTFATNLLKAGKSLAFVKDAGHWETGQLVIDTYGHLEASDVSTASAEVGENWGNSIKKQYK